MLSKFAYFVIGLGIYGILVSAGAPMLIRARTYFQFHRLGMEKAVEKVANAELWSVAPNLVIILLLSIVGVVLGLGLLRRCEWARRGWLIVCVIWLSATIFFTARAPSLSAIFPLAFRLVVFVVSLRILLAPTIRDQFLNERR
jgi:uncharacterized membrane protein (DUF2068 family)